mgnify:CR=1 FL=1
MRRDRLSNVWGLMKNFKVTEIAFDPKDIEPTMEDEFTIVTIARELDSIDDPQKLKMAAMNLAMVSVQRQGIIRGLCKRLADAEKPNDKVVVTDHKGR